MELQKTFKESYMKTLRDAVKSGEVDVVIYPTQKDEDPVEGEGSVISLIKECGYREYQAYISDDGVYYVHMLVREE